MYTKFGVHVFLFTSFICVTCQVTLAELLSVLPPFKDFSYNACETKWFVCCVLTGF